MALRFIIFTIIISMLPSLSYAQDKEYTLEQLCAGLQEKPKRYNARVSADYTPGVDVHGNDVTSADLNNITSVRDPIHIPITINLAQRYGIDLPIGAEMKPEVAGLDIFQDGSVLYNGKKLDKKLEILCKDYRHKDDNPVISQEPAEKKAQETQDTIQGLYPPQDE